MREKIKKLSTFSKNLLLPPSYNYHYLMHYCMHYYAKKAFTLLKGGVTTLHISFQRLIQQQCIA